MIYTSKVNQLFSECMFNKKVQIQVAGLMAITNERLF